MQKCFYLVFCTEQLNSWNATIVFRPDSLFFVVVFFLIFLFISVIGKRTFPLVVSGLYLWDQMRSTSNFTWMQNTLAIVCFFGQIVFSCLGYSILKWKIIKKHLWQKPNSLKDMVAGKLHNKLSVVSDVSFTCSLKHPHMLTAGGAV